MNKGSGESGLTDSDSASEADMEHMKPHLPDEAVHQRAKRAAERLGAAMRAATGITLPSLRAGHCFADFPHVELGGCHADLADRLADFFERCTERCAGRCVEPEERR